MEEKEYLIPDSRWSNWNCDSFQTFINKFLIKGKFHGGVPEDIINSYKIVEKLMAYSYYCYELYDEALSKLSRIFEMAVKQRAEQIGIKYPVNKYVPLEKRIKDLSNDINPELENEWLSAKNVRNLFAHPDKPLIGLVTITEGFIEQYINIINRLFKPKSYFEEKSKLKIELDNQFLRFKNGIFILQFDQNYLIYSAIIYSAHIGKENIYLLGCHPILKFFPKTMGDYEIFNPIFFHLKDLKVSIDSCSGIDIKTSQKINITSTDNLLNIAANHKFIVELESASQEVKDMHLMFTDQTISLEIVKFEYDYFWD